MGELIEANRAYVEELSDSQQRLLSVLMIPENQKKGITDICKLANIHPDVYYKSFQDPDFLEAYRKFVKIPIWEATADILERMIVKAKEGSYKHAELLLKMLELVPRPEAITVQNNSIQVQKMDDGELEALLREFNIPEKASGTSRVKQTQVQDISVLRGKSSKDKDEGPTIDTVSV